MTTAASTLSAPAAVTAETATDRVVILSDLHLGSGVERINGSVDRFELFTRDRELVHFFTFLAQKTMDERRRQRLILLGDFFDFSRVRLSREASRSTSLECASILKLNRIAEGHPEVFAALRELLESGLAIDVIPGNHDLEIMREPVWEHLVSLIVPTPSGRERSTLRLHPWIVYLPGLLYAEHGHQYHDINASFALVDRPLASPNQQRVPIGAALDEHVLGIIEASSLPGTVGLDPLGLVMGSYRSRPTRLATDALRHGRFLVAFVRSLYAARSANVRAERRRYQRQSLVGYNSRIGLSVETLVAIDELSRQIAAGLPRRFASSSLDRSGVNRLRHGRGRHDRDPERVEQTDVRTDPLSEEDLVRSGKNRLQQTHAVAREIHRLLELEGKAVPFYAFAHTHHPENIALLPPATHPRFLNPGSWLGAGFRASPESGPPSKLTYIEIARGDERGPTATLMAWNDAAGRAEPIR
jgi:hypothetical protein